MTPDALALRYAILREARGAIPSKDFVGLKGERCARCRQGYQTKVIRRRRRMVKTDSGEQPLWEIEEKIVCGLCWHRAAELHGVDEATKTTPRFKGIKKPEATGPVQVSVRPHATEDRLARQADKWKRVAPYFECVPPGVDPAQWRQSVEALILFQHPQVGRFDRVVELGTYLFSDLGPWSERAVERGIGLVRLWIGLRLKRQNWQREEARVESEDSIKVSRAAEMLGCSTETVRNMIRNDVLTWVNVSQPGAGRPDYRVSLESVRKELRRRSEATSGSGSTSQQMASVFA